MRKLAIDYSERAMLTIVAMHLAVLAVLTLTLGPDVAKRLASGDPTALRAAYDAHAGRVLALALRIVRSQAEAEDVVQDTFLAVWRRAGEYDAKRGELSAWIMGMARSRCIDRVRRAKVRARFVERAEPPSANSQAPDESAVASEAGKRVHKLLASLPPEQRTALELAYFEGLTQQQIAERTGAPLGTVKTRLRLSLEKLAKELEALS